MKRRAIDWRFLVCLTLLSLVGYLILGGIEQARDNRAKGERIDTLIVELQKQHDVAEAERTAASAERGQLLAGQRELEAKYDALVAQQTALLTYLRRHGVVVPARFLVAPRVQTSGPAPVGPRRSGATAPRAAAPPPATAGKSGKVPPGKKPARRGRR